LASKPAHVSNNDPARAAGVVQSEDPRPDWPGIL